ncbi:CC-NBS-LRR resistance protein, partial [Trifolium medium]|nr:CC-NBS-LRR resistance protein [Trifolium medium]
LSKLESLKIEGKLPDVSVLPPQWKQKLSSLKYLEIGDVDDLEFWFKDGFPSLQKVVVYGSDLKALPGSMCDLESLQHIKMMGCHKLASLPEKMKELKLDTLEIWDCPLLVERCQKETGVDWLKISHIQNLIVK